MKNGFIQILTLMMISSLTACSTLRGPENTTTTAGTEAPAAKPVDENTLASSNTGVYTNNPENKFTSASNSQVGGNLINSMDSNDKTKMSRGLDKAIGKITTWTNEMTGIQYTVNPIQKVVIGGNQFCRKYMLTATKGENTREINAVACVGTDGEWHAV